ncbi:MAG: hypothetical protein HZB71_03275 [Betaproteobacteria bacterium]|nr:hypothetical protein [Betaproteobacteria bacterium]
MHPAVRLLAYLIAALVLPGLPFFILPIVLALGLTLGWRRPLLRLFWRTRWLLLVMLAGYAYTLPGAALWPALAQYSPSLPGLRQGALQVMRLLTLLAWLDLLVLRLPADALIGALYTLLRPLRRVGLHVERIALRLGLTLAAIEGMERGRGNLSQLFAPDAGQDLPDRVNLSLTPWSLRDRCIALSLFVGAFGLWFSA